MNKALKITLISLCSLVAVIILAAILLPLLFKKPIVEALIRTANENLKAKIELKAEDIELTLFKNFPNFTVSVHNLAVRGQDNFAGTTLANVPEFNLVLDLMSVFRGAPELIEIALENPQVNIIYDKNGVANYDIMVSDSTAAVVQTDTNGTKKDEDITKETTSSSFKILLREAHIDGLHLTYTDSVSDSRAVIEDFSLKMNGDFSQSVFILKTNAEAKGITYQAGSIAYVKDATLGADLAFDADMDKMLFAVRSNGVEYNIRFNDINLLCEGSLSMPSGGEMVFDVNLASAKTEFKSLLSLIPSEMMKDLDGLKTSGNFSIGGYFKGTYNEQTFPAFALSIKADHGFVQYPSLPRSIDNINIEMEVACPQSPASSNFDNTVVNMPTFSMDFGGNPIHASLVLKTPVSDPDFDVKVNASLDLGTVRDIIPLDKEDKLTGKIDADVAMRGRMSMFDNKQYDKVTASGSLHVKGMAYQSPSLPRQIQVKTLELAFNPQAAELKDLSIAIGGSDVQMHGSLRNYIAYIFQDKTIEGKLFVRSTNLDLNEIMPCDTASVANASPKGQTTTAGDTPAKPASTTPSPDEQTPIVIPANIDFEMDVLLKKVVYGDIVMDNLGGNIGLKNSVAYLKNVKTGVLGGNVTINGSYDALQAEYALADVKLNIDALFLSQIASQLSTIKAIAPIIEGADGQVSGYLTLDTRFNAKMEPVISTMNSQGTLLCPSIRLKDNQLLTTLSKIIKFKKPVGEIGLDDINLSYTIKNGVLSIVPTKVQIDAIKMLVSGDLDLTHSTMYMITSMNVPYSSLGGDAENMVKAVTQAASTIGLKIDMGDAIDISTLISGDVNKPKIQLLYGEERYTSLGDYAAAESKKILEKGKKQAVETVKNEAGKLLENLLGGSSSNKDTQGSNSSGDTPQGEPKKEKPSVESLLKGLFK